MSIQKVVDAIKEIDYHRNFKIEGNNIDDCTIEWINGSAAISKDDIKAKMKDIEDNGTVKDQKKASGKQKLKDLGLNDDEIQALMGV
jgi:hypothetical protein|tara:strand:- start:88 stop:348 length:261 start_codon:yes stop_codon:yes gene_type:complete